MEHKIVAFELTGLDQAGRTIEGYASTFGNVDLGADVIHPGAFAKTLAERGNKVRLLWQHHTDEPLGKPLELREDARGLFIKAIISDTARGRDALALLRDGAIEGLSIGYDAVKGGLEYQNVDGQTVRHLREVKLYEVSIVSFPMNEQAGIIALKEAEAVVDAASAADTAPEPPETPPETKSGRVLSRASATQIRAAIAELEALLANAFPPEPDAEPDEDEDEKHAALAEAASALLPPELDAAGPSADTHLQAKRLALEIELRNLELSLTEV